MHNYLIKIYIYKKKKFPKMQKFASLHLYDTLEGYQLHYFGYLSGNVQAIFYVITSASVYVCLEFAHDLI